MLPVFRLSSTLCARFRYSVPAFPDWFLWSEENVLVAHKTNTITMLMVSMHSHCYSLPESMPDVQNGSQLMELFACKGCVSHGGKDVSVERLQRWAMPAQPQHSPNSHPHFLSRRHHSRGLPPHPPRLLCCVKVRPPLSSMTRRRHFVALLREHEVRLHHAHKGTRRHSPVGEGTGPSTYVAPCLLVHQRVRSP